MSRREWLEICAGGAGAAVLSGCSSGRLPRLAMMPKTQGNRIVALAGVLRAGNRTIDRVIQATRAAAEAATDFSWLSSGDSVLLKVACNSGNSYPATTDPNSVRGIVALLKERGAGQVVVADMSGVEHLRFGRDATTGSTEMLMRKNGLYTAAIESGAEIHAFEEAGWDGFYEEQPLSGQNWPSSLLMPNILKSIDHIVLMPRCSRHALLGSTLGLKSAVGWWRFDSRLDYHQGAASLFEKTAEGNTVPSLLNKQRLVISSATKVQVTYGPDVGYVTHPDTGLVIASESVLAHDMVSLSWLFENRSLLPAGKLASLSDPYQSQLSADLGNRVLCKWLGGGTGLGAEQLVRHDFHNVRQDRVLYRAMQIEGGVPRIDLEAVNGLVTSELVARLRTYWGWG